MRCLRPASCLTRMPEPPHKSRSRSEPEKASLPGREPSHSADAVALLTQQSASSTLKARPAKLHHAAADADREDNHAPGSVSSEIICLTLRQRLDNNSIMSGSHSYADYSQAWRDGSLGHNQHRAAQKLLLIRSTSRCFHQHVSQPIRLGDHNRVARRRVFEDSPRIVGFALPCRFVQGGQLEFG